MNLSNLITTLRLHILIYYIGTYKFVEVLTSIQTKTVILIRSSNEPKLLVRLQIRNNVNFIDIQIKKLNEKNISNFEYTQILAL